MEKPVGTFEAATPGVLLLANQIERELIPMDSKIEQALGLLLRGKAAKFLQFNASRGRSGIGHQ
jgi:hypothetical protein